MLKTPQVSGCLANPYSWSLAYGQGEYDVLLHHFPALINVSPSPGVKSHFSNPFHVSSKKAGSSTKMYRHHPYQRTSWTPPLFQRHFWQNTHCLWTKCTLKSIRPSRTGEILILSPPVITVIITGPSWEAAGLSNDLIWKCKKKWRNKLLFCRR